MWTFTLQSYRHWRSSVIMNSVLVDYRLANINSDFKIYLGKLASSSMQI